MSEQVNVTLGGQEVSVIVEGGALGPGMSLALQDLNAAVADAAQSAIDAEAAEAAAVAATAFKADLNGSNILGANQAAFRTQLVVQTGINVAGAAANGVTNDAPALQTAMNLAASLGVPLALLPGKTYLVTSGLNCPAGLTMHFNGATISTASNITVLTVAASRVTLHQPKLRGPNNGYQASQIGIKITGVLNGAAVAPTFVSDTTIIDADIADFGYLAIQPLYDERTRITNPIIRNCGYGAIITQGSKDFVGIGGLFDTFYGETGTGDLEANILSWSCADNETDFVRYPPSRNCVWLGGEFKNCPTWVALDTHGGEDCHFVSPVVKDCRRAVFVVARLNAGPIRCTATNVTAYNTYAQGAINPNGSSKRDIGALISGDSSTYLAQDCHISGRFSGFGSVLVAAPVAGAGMVRTDQACSLDVHVINPYGAGVSVDTQARGHIRAVIENPQSNGVGVSTTSPCYVKVDGTGTDVMNVTLDVQMLRTNTALNTYVGVRALVSSGTLANMVLNFERLTYDSGIDLSTTSSLGTVRGEFPVTFTMDVAGLSVATTPVTIWRSKNIGYISVPLLAGTSTSGAFTLGTSTPLPAYMRPTDTSRQISYIMNDSTAAFGIAEIGTGGAVTLYRDALSTGWTATGSKRLYDQVWQIALP